MSHVEERIQKMSGQRVLNDKPPSVEIMTKRM